MWFLENKFLELNSMDFDANWKFISPIYLILGRSSAFRAPLNIRLWHNFLQNPRKFPSRPRCFIRGQKPENGKADRTKSEPEADFITMQSQRIWPRKIKRSFVLRGCLHVRTRRSDEPLGNSCKITKACTRWHVMHQSSSCKIL